MNDNDPAETLNAPTQPPAEKPDVKVVEDYKPSTYLTKQQSRDRIKAAGRGDDPDKVAPLAPPKPVNSGDPPEAEKPEKKPKAKPKPKAAAEAKSSAPPPAKPAAKPPAEPKKSAPPPAAAASEPPAASAAPAKPAAKEPSRADIEKRARAVDRDARRVEARQRQIEVAEQTARETLEKLDPGNPNFVENLAEYYRSQGKDVNAALRAYAAKVRSQGQPPQPGQPPAPAAPASQAATPPPAAPARDPEVEQLIADNKRMRAEQAKTKWTKFFLDEVTVKPPQPDAHPTLAGLNEEYLAEVMVYLAAEVWRKQQVQLDTLQLYDMIEAAEAEEAQAFERKRKRKPATTGSGPEREPAGTQPLKHEPPKAINVSSRARAGSVPEPEGRQKDPKSKIDRGKLKEILHKRG